MLEDSKFFEAVQALAQSISQWDLLIIAGSLVVIVSTAYYRPATRSVRLAYFLFLPAWSFLAFSIYEGIKIQGSYVAYLVAARNKSGTASSTIEEIALNMENATRLQIQALEFALLCLAVWLLIYILWWVLTDQARGNHK